MDEDGWTKPEANIDRVWRSYVDEFPQGHALGLLQECCQNAFDAYSSGTDPREMKVVIKYDANERTLTIRDFGTSGMHHCETCEWGKTPDGPCTSEDGCPWGAFHNMGYTTKLSSAALGSRGMGKSLLILAGERTVVRTHLPGGDLAASEWIKKEDWRWRLAEGEEQELSSPGTELVTTNVVDEVHEVLADIDAAVSELQHRWFRLLEEGATITYLLVDGTETTHREISPPRWPNTDESQGEGASHLKKAKIVVSLKGRKLGELRDLNLFISSRRLKRADPRRGIALVKNGKQTITRYTEFPSSIPEGIRSRLFGWCDVICTEEEPFLQAAETSTHTGYKRYHPTFKAVKRQLNKVVRRFTEPFISEEGERVTESDVNEADEILEVINAALTSVEGFSPFELEEEGDEKKRAPEEPRDFIYLSRVEVEKKRYERGETVPVRAIVKNPTDQEKLVRVTFEHFDPTPVVVEEEETAPILRPGTIENPSTQEIEWQLELDESLAPGRHWVQVSLRDKKWNELTDREGAPIKARRSVFCEEEPPEIKRPGGRRRTPGPGGKGFRKLRPHNLPEMAQNYEARIDPSQAEAYFNLAGKRLAHQRANAQNRRGYWPAVGEVLGEEILRLILDKRLEKKDSWSADDVHELVADLVEKKARFEHTIVDLLKKG